MEEKNKGKFDLSFFAGRRIFLTGHTGFKGSWLARILADAGAEVMGYALPPAADAPLFRLAQVEGDIRHIEGDIRDFPRLLAEFQGFQPEIVLHLAAQPIVAVGYEQPRETYEVNLMGTVNLLECVRRTPGVRSVVAVTTDKVYKSSAVPRREGDALDGFDPYANSKSCAELAAGCYRRAFLEEMGVRLSTVRAGNVIGGGDYAPRRILPDCLRATEQGEDILLRRPDAVRPYQHVLEALFAYLLLCARQYEDPALAGAYNIGPGAEDCLTTQALAELFLRAWGEGKTKICLQPSPFMEDGYLALDSGKFSKKLGWQPVWRAGTAVEKTVEWAKCHRSEGDIPGCMRRQIEEYLREKPW